MEKLIQLYLEKAENELVLADSGYGWLVNLNIGELR